MIAHALTSDKVLHESFALALANSLLARYRKIPSASFLAREFNLRARHCEPITQETARRWLKGMALPKFDKLVLLRSWLDLDLNALGIPSIKSVEKENVDGLNQTLSQELIKDRDSYIKATKKIKDTIRELAKELLLLRPNYVHHDGHSENMTPSFPQKILDSLSTQIAVINQAGNIIQVNKAWRIFADENAAPNHTNHFDQCNYLTVCDTAYGSGSKNANVMAEGVRAVLRGELTEFTHKYPCHSPEEKRWFVVRTTNLEYAGEAYAIVSHQRISEANYQQIEYP